MLFSSSMLPSPVVILNPSLLSSLRYTYPRLLERGRDGQSGFEVLAAGTALHRLYLMSAQLSMVIWNAICGRERSIC